MSLIDYTDYNDQHSLSQNYTYILIRSGSTSEIYIYGWLNTTSQWDIINKIDWLNGISVSSVEFRSFNNSDDISFNNPAYETNVGITVQKFTTWKMNSTCNLHLTQNSNLPYLGLSGFPLNTDVVIRWTSASITNGLLITNLATNNGLTNNSLPHLVPLTTLSLSGQLNPIDNNGYIVNINYPQNPTNYKTFINSKTQIQPIATLSVINTTNIVNTVTISPSESQYLTVMYKDNTQEIISILWPNWVISNMIQNNTYSIMISLNNEIMYLPIPPLLALPLYFDTTNLSIVFTL